MEMAKKQYPISSEQRHEYYKTFKAKNADKVTTKRRCVVCRAEYTYFNYSRHTTTKRHREFLIIQ